MYRIKYLLGSLVAVFSLVYVIFGLVGWIDNQMGYTGLLTCLVLGSLHLAGGSWLLLSSLRDFRRERDRVDTIIRKLIRTNGGRLVAADLAEQAEISNDDAQQYLEKRARFDVSVVMQDAGGDDVFFFGQRFWNN